jgi:hypothetical protein
VLRPVIIACFSLLFVCSAQDTVNEVKRLNFNTEVQFPKDTEVDEELCTDLAERTSQFMTQQGMGQELQSSLQGIDCFKRSSSNPLEELVGAFNVSLIAANYELIDQKPMLISERRMPSDITQVWVKDNRILYVVHGYDQNQGLKSALVAIIDDSILAYTGQGRAFFIPFAFDPLLVLPQQVVLLRDGSCDFHIEKSVFFISTVLEPAPDKNLTSCYFIYTDNWEGQAQEIAHLFDRASYLKHAEFLSDDASIFYQVWSRTNSEKLVVVFSASQTGNGLFIVLFQ